MLSPPQTAADFISLSTQPNWKEALIRAVHRTGMDPWDLDVERLCGEFLKEMGNYPLPVAGGFVLAMAILLKLQSLYLEEEEEEELPEEGFLEVPVLPVRRRRITLADVIQTVERRIQKKREKPKEEVPPPTLPSGLDVETRAQRLLSRLTGEVVEFRRVAEGIADFFALLHLEAKGKVSTYQERPYGEIRVRKL